MITTIGQWNIKPGKEAKAHKALKSLAEEVVKNEPGTLVYFVHAPDMKGFNLPTPSPTAVYFYEVYKDLPALQAHLEGSFKSFVKENKKLFLTTKVSLPDGSTVEELFVTGNSMVRLGGFARPESKGKKVKGR